MRSIESRITKLEQQCIPQSNRYLPLMVKVTLCHYAHEVAAGIRKPEDATEEAALAELQNTPSSGGSLAERMEAAISRGKARREQGGTAQ